MDNERSLYVRSGSETFHLIDNFKRGKNMAVQRRKKEPKADLHITINPLVIDYFETLRAVHKREYSEYIEEKLLELIKEVAPEKYLEMKLALAEKEVIDIKQAMIEVKLLKAIDTEKQKANDERDKLRNEEESKLKTHRVTMFKKYFRTLKYQREKHIPHDWSKIQQDFVFKNKVEAQVWIDDMMASGIEA